MDTGMLWFDNDPDSDLIAKVDRAALYYEAKYGIKPNQCVVHPTMIKEDQPGGFNLKISSNRSILPNHFWIGVQQTKNNPINP